MIHIQRRAKARLKARANLMAKAQGVDTLEVASKVVSNLLKSVIDTDHAIRVAEEELDGMRYNTQELSIQSVDAITPRVMKSLGHIQEARKALEGVEEQIKRAKSELRGVSYTADTDETIKAGMKVDPMAYYEDVLLASGQIMAALDDLDMMAAAEVALGVLKHINNLPPIPASLPDGGDFTLDIDRRKMSNYRDLISEIYVAVRREPVNIREAKLLAQGALTLAGGAMSLNASQVQRTRPMSLPELQY